MRVCHPELTHAQVAGSVERINAAIINALAKGGRAELRGFGSFFLSERPSRQLRNPLNGEKVYVPQRAVPRFKAGKILKRSINERTPRAM